MTDNAQGGSPPQFDPSEFETKMLDAMNRGMSARGTKFEQSLSKKFEEFSQAIASSVQKTLEEYRQSFEDRRRDEKETKGGKGDSTESLALKSFERQLNEMRAENESNKKRADEERAKNRGSLLRTRLQEELAKHGMNDPMRSKLAIGHLVDSMRRVQFVDEESERLGFVDDNGELLDLSTGLRDWAKTDEAKIYLPPTNARGSGGRSGAGGAPNSAADKERTVNQFWEGLADHLRNL
jgi:hypothetical protein